MHQVSAVKRTAVRGKRRNAASHHLFLVVGFVQPIRPQVDTVIIYEFKFENIAVSERSCIGYSVIILAVLMYNYIIGVRYKRISKVLSRIKNVTLAVFIEHSISVVYLMNDVSSTTTTSTFVFLGMLLEVFNRWLVLRSEVGQATATHGVSGNSQDSKRKRRY